MKITEHKLYPALLVVTFSLLGLCFPAAVTQFSMVVDELASEMALPKQTILLADTLRAVCLVVAMFLSGFAYKKMGLRKTMTLGILFQVVPQFVIPFAVNTHSLPLLFLFKGMQGMNAMAFPLYISTITQWVNRKYCGFATALFNGSFTAGAGIGAYIVGRLVPLFGWQTSFYFIGGACLLFALPALLLVQENPKFAAAKSNVATKKTNVYHSIVHNPITWLLVITLVANTWVSQAITVDMSVFAQDIGYSYGETGTLMLVISVVTVLSSILGGAFSDHLAARAQNSVRARTMTLAVGYVISAVAAVLLPMVQGTFSTLTVAACAMMFGASWSAGAFWAIPNEVYATEDNVAGTAFCSGASNIPNPIAPVIVGVLLGSSGYWTAGWMTCMVVSVCSVIAALLIAAKTKA